MRPQQQNRRMRGRNNGGGGNNNNRRGPNPLTRNYESNGPDVKIRGSAQQIAEKYAALARDAMSSGDRVMAENYLQHAEHYNRIIAAAQAQMPIQQVQHARDDLDDDLDEDGYGFDNNGAGHGGQRPQAAEQPQPPANGSGPQPVIEGMPAEVALNSETQQAENAQRERGASEGQPPAGGQPAEGEEGQFQRRSRRPRRNRGERNAEAGAAQNEPRGGGEDAQSAAASEMTDGQIALAAFEN